VSALRHLEVGDKLVVYEPAWNGKPSRLTYHTVTKVNRTNLVASDGRKWNRDAGVEPGYENRGGYQAHAEAWNEDMHPFLDEFTIAQKLLDRLNDLRQYRYRERAKLFAKALPYLKLAAKELGLEVAE